jgi:hypothetical protein
LSFGRIVRALLFLVMVTVLSKWSQGSGCLSVSNPETKSESQDRYPVYKVVITKTLLNRRRRVMMMADHHHPQLCLKNSSNKCLTIMLRTETENEDDSDIHV